MPKAKSKSKLHIAKDLDLPLDVVMDKKSILAMTGAGKTNTAVDLVEETLDAGIQVVVLDPKGDWWGMRSSSDGKSEGYPITVFGGIHGDIPLEAESGKVLGEYLATNPVSCVLDVSEFSQGELFRFAKDFGIAFYKAKRRNPTAMQIVLEEADEIVPQGTNKVFGPDLPGCIGAWSKIWKRGRFIGIGCLLVSQRSAAVNKDLLTQTDMLVIMRTGSPQDVKAVDAWLVLQPDQEKREKVLAEIQSLPTGHAYVWAPRRKIFGKYHLRMRRTFDAGETPEVGKTRIEPKVLAKVDLERLSGEMKTFVETSRSKDPTILQRRVRELQRELETERAKKHHVGAGARDVGLAVDRATKSLQRLGLEREKLHAKHAARVLAGVDAAITSLGKVRAIIVDDAPGPLEGFDAAVAASSTPASTTRTTSASSRSSTSTPAPARARAAARDSNEVSEGITRPQQRILDALAELHKIGVARPRRELVAVYADASPTSSAYVNNLGALRTTGLVDYPASGAVALSDAGAAKANAPEIDATPEVVLERALAQLDNPRGRIVRALVDAYPDALDRDELAKRADASPTSSAYVNNLGALRSAGFLDYPDRGTVRAESWLLLEKES